MGGKAKRVNSYGHRDDANDVPVRIAGNVLWIMFSRGIVLTGYYKEGVRYPLALPRRVLLAETLKLPIAHGTLRLGKSA